MADYPQAEEHLVPRNFMFDTNTHQALVVHKTGGDATPQAVYNTFLASGNPGKSVHYAVGTDGSIWQFVPESLGAGGNCCVEAGHDPFWDQFGGVNLNTVTFSVEHCDAALDNSTPLTPAQRAASFRLIAYLVKKYSIPASHIKTHASLDPQSRARCPGNYPMSELLAYVAQGGTTMPIPQGWPDDGHTLTAPNGVPVTLGFRQHILDAAAWDEHNVPQEAEYHADPVQLHAPQFGAGQRQCFRDGLLWWTPAQGVVQEPYLGLELDAAYKEIAALKAAPPVQPAPNVVLAISTLQALDTTIADNMAEVLKALGA